MTTYSKATVIGYVGADPETRQLPSGDNLTTFRVAVTEKARAGSEERTTWYSVAAFGRLGEICAAYVHKGSLVFVEGPLSLRPYTDRNGAERTSVDLRAADVRLLDRRSAEGDTVASTTPAASAVDDAEDEVPF